MLSCVTLAWTDCVWMLICSIIRLWAGENQVLAGKAGAIDAVVAAMRAHVGNSGVSVQAKQCLAILRK